MGDHLPTVLSGLALLAAVGKPLGALIVRVVDGIRSVPDGRPTTVPAAPTVEQRLAALEDAYRKSAEAASEAAQKAGREAAAKELRDLIKTAAQAKKKTNKESDDGRRSEDPPTDP